MRHFTCPRWIGSWQASRIKIVVSVMLAAVPWFAAARGKEQLVDHPTFYRTTKIDGLSIFYREAGPKNAPTLLLLHGLPSSSRMFESPPTTRDSDTATGRTRKTSHIRSITSPKS
jgi:hypothetical protein